MAVNNSRKVVAYKIVKTVFLILVWAALVSFELEWHIISKLQH